MSTAIIYSTKYGCTGKCAEKLSSKLNDKADLYNLKKGEIPDLHNYDMIIIGGSIYIGKIQKEISQFCLKNLDKLRSKKLGLYICCMAGEADAQKELKDAFPQELFAASIAKENFGGEFIFKDMNFMDRLIVKKVSKIDKDTYNILETNIDKFAQIMNNA